ncbi:inner nuclear membrane protein Man1 [Anabrus simplex]|uniref:inner nuclear membrane protein Man1 n=1 Tax=Anabrus simplex TaxID=316456 RepID=UPI0035A39493
MDESEDMCILQKHLKPALEALEILSPKLMALAADAYCDNDTSPGGPICTLMTEDEAVDYLVESMDMGPSEARESFKNLKIVLLSNPSWAVSVSDCSTEQLSYTSAYERELMEKGGLTLRNPVIPFGCQLKQLVFRLARWASFLMTTSMAVTGLLFGVWRYKNYQETRRQEMYMIVNKIIAMVKSHQERMQLPGAIGSNYISVEQCKDEILSPGCRASLVTAWKDAEKFIDKNESRISTDLKQVGGKLIRVWHWIPTTTVGRTSSCNGSPGQSLRSYHTKSNGPELLDASPTFHNGINSSSSFNRKSRRSKVWQGQAFDTMAGSPNSLPCSPTPCLKIRHMFDPSLEHGEDWPILIQDAILEKCEGINILHIFVDCNSSEGCVFMKCSSHEEAGKAYRALHGWWFDTKLVTVKYLRTGRYHERFPEAAKETAPLRPSNSKESSLQELWHFI